MLSWSLESLIHALHNYMENKIAEFIENGNLYLILGETEFKDPTTRKWIKAIQYKPLYGDMNRTYVRETTDFNKKFKTWDGDVELRKKNS